VLKKITRDAFFTIITLFAVAQMTGCAFGTRQVALQYSPAMCSSVIPGSPTVSIHNFTDTRTDRSLGCVRNGYGMKLASVESKPGEPAVPMWISTALSDELKRAGCSVELGSSKGESRGQFVISGDVQRVYVDSYMTLKGEISMAVAMKNGDRSVINRLYHAEASKMNWWGSSKEFQKTLDMTLQDLMKNMIPDIADAMSIKYENLPVASVPGTVTSASTMTMPTTMNPTVQINAEQPATTFHSKPTVDATSQLKKLKELKELGLLTEQEYETKRKELVGQL
jgi:hypothetical protein